MSRLLLIDDEERIRNILSMSLRRDGYQVLTAEDGGKGIEMFRQNLPLIVLTDIRMPGMDGIEVLKRIKEIDPDTEVIVITGHGDIQLAIRSLQLGASDFIAKPVSDDALSIALKRAEQKLEIKRKLKSYTHDLESIKREIKQLQKELIQSERLAAVGRTVAGLAHGIKNILNGLKGGVYIVNTAMKKSPDSFAGDGVENVEKGGNESKLRTGWDMVERNINRVSALVLDLLSYSKEREPEYEKYDPNIIVNEVCDLMESKAKKNDVTLTRRLDKETGEVYLDSKGIHICLLNLVSNAIDACIFDPDAEKDWQVKVKAHSDREGGVIFDVVDNGCGMDQEVKDRIFTEFFSTKGNRGTGLGLLVSQKIIYEHKGTMDVESEPGKGTRFLIRLPKQEYKK